MIKILPYEEVGENDAYSFLSNLSLRCFTSVETDSAGKTFNVQWLSTEHYYQAHKFPVNSEEFLRIANTENPIEVYSIGHNNPKQHENWDDIKENILLKGMVYKFTQNEDIRKKLIETGSEKIIEISPSGYWGNGADGKGKNRMGILLMQTREILKTMEMEKARRQDKPSESEL